MFSELLGGEIKVWKIKPPPHGKLNGSYGIQEGHLELERKRNILGGIEVANPSRKLQGRGRFAREGRK